MQGVFFRKFNPLLLGWIEFTWNKKTDKNGGEVVWAQKPENLCIDSLYGLIWGRFHEEPSSQLTSLQNQILRALESKSLGHLSWLPKLQFSKLDDFEVFSLHI